MISKILPILTLIFGTYFGHWLSIRNTFTHKRLEKMEALYNLMNELVSVTQTLLETPRGSGERRNQASRLQQLVKKDIL